jgi:hypothetical protein
MTEEHIILKSFTAVGTRCADHVTPLYPLQLALLPSLTGGGRSVGIVRSRTEAMEFWGVSPVKNYNYSANPPVIANTLAIDKT